MTQGWVDRVIFTATSSGTGDFVVSSAVTGYQTPSSASAVDGYYYHYAAQSSDLSEWEVGTGVYTSATQTLARTTVEFSSNSNSLVNFSSPPQVMITALAADFETTKVLAADVTYHVRSDPVSVTFTTGTPGTVNWTSHGLSAGDAAVFSGPYLGGGNTLPTEITEGQIYYVKTVVNANSFTIAATVGGTAIDFSTAGGGTQYGQTGSDNNDGLSLSAPLLNFQTAVDIICTTNWLEHVTTGSLPVLAIKGTGVFIEAPTFGNHDASVAWCYPSTLFPLPNKVVFRPTLAQCVANFGSIILVNGVSALWQFHDGYEFDGINCGTGAAAVCTLGQSQTGISGAYIKNISSGWCFYNIGATVNIQYTLDVTDCSGLFTLDAAGGMVAGSLITIRWHGTCSFTTIFTITGSRLEFAGNYTGSQFSGVVSGTSYAITGDSYFSTEDAPPGTAGTHDDQSVVLLNGVYIAGGGGRYRDTVYLGSTNGTVTVKPQASAGNWTLQLPTSAGTSGYALTTDGTGVTSWSAVSANAAGTTGNLQYNNASAFAGDAYLNTDGLGQLTVGTTSHGGLLRLSGTTSGVVTVRGQAAAGTWTLQLPTTAGTSGYLLGTDGSGVTSWLTPASGSGLPGGSVNSVQYQVNATTFGGAANFSISSGNPNVSSGNAYLYNSAIAIQANSANEDWFFGNAGNLTGTGIRNVAFGSLALASYTSSTRNVAIGYKALNTNLSGSDNVAIGYNACAAMTASANVVVVGAGAAAVGQPSSCIALGAGAMANASTASNCVALGNAALGVAGSGSKNLAIGDSCMAVDSGTNNIGIGVEAMFHSLLTGNRNIAIGSTSGDKLTSASSNVLVGVSSGVNLISGGNNIAIGDTALSGGRDMGNNVAIGRLAIQSGTSNTCSYNVCIGDVAGRYITTGDGNVCIGADASGGAPGITTGSQNVMIGYDISVQTTTASGQLSIQNIIYGTGNTATQGNISTGKIGIGVKAPATKFEVAGSIKIAATAVATLPTVGNTGAFYFVTDAQATSVFAAIAVGGGTAGFPVYDDGVNWRIG